MILKFDNIEDKLIVELMGELDHHNASEVRNKIDDMLDRDNINKLIMNFSGVSFMDSSGIGAVIGRYKKLSMKGGKLCITNLKPSVKRVFELSGLFKIIDIYDDVEQGIKSV
ncbi:anti-sigma F factor antagonist [Clostridium argentinense CDC 2741]|uniref:Anti-sigma F factor antagonist n=1 Tax=Clostridium argentinense CDC 2741 TaxID=1418104 RepID=A0A0C1RB20_9CLOT|nr:MULTISPECIES: anti-sigma F factor antagonist [Clostridium]ARC84516.1 anti-sigma F factor antagonist [Clostridium argentinense]KIE47616.1 anti-sigma F factor antagonist [Clostridium argentinense CDC 2741]NFF38700.1 anti-sigma F factor antagonist [Clostridium argentinense]NFP48925.1 anti-sigma F factor antagonist [Clostridium argentinense]NFP72925.1 anti-sigma F factor antagonist [Clostridium argentinense]